MILDQLRQELNAALEPWAKAQGLDALPPYSLEEPPGAIEADLACNLALLLAKPLRKSPRLLAEDLKKTLDGSLPLVEDITIAGAGFVNFRLSLSRLQKEVAAIIDQKTAYGRLAHVEHGK